MKIALFGSVIVLLANCTNCTKPLELLDDDFLPVDQGYKFSRPTGYRPVATYPQHERSIGFPSLSSEPVIHHVDGIEYETELAQLVNTNPKFNVVHISRPSTPATVIHNHVNPRYFSMPVRIALLAAAFAAGSFIPKEQMASFLSGCGYWIISTAGNAVWYVGCKLVAQIPGVTWSGITKSLR